MSKVRKALVVIGLVATSTPWAIVAILALAPSALIRMLFTSPDQAERITSSLAKAALFSSLALLPLSACAFAGAHIRIASCRYASGSSSGSLSPWPTC